MAKNHHHHLMVFLMVLLFSHKSGAYGVGDSTGSGSGSLPEGRKHYSRYGNQNHIPERDYHMKKIEAFKASLIGHQRDSLISPSPPFIASISPPAPVVGGSTPRVYHVSSYLGADPTGKSDSTDAILKALSDASNPPNDDDTLIAGIANAGGAQIQLDGGIYLVSRPLRFPVTGVGNIVIQGGTLKASHDFPKDGYLIDLSPTPTTTTEAQSSEAQSSEAQSSEAQSSEAQTLDVDSSTYAYEYITLRDLLLDSNYISNGISIINSLRTSLDNLFITHFTSFGVRVRSGHETLIRNAYLGQHITAGGDPHERNFTGTAISLAGNDNVLSDVIIFSAQTGVIVSGQANLLSGVHCYNKATGFGGTGIYLKLPGLTQTRIVDSYMDYTGIVAEDPVQLLIKNCFFLGDAGVVLKSVNGVVDGVVIVDNMFSGNGNGVEIVRLDEAGGNKFRQVGMVVVERNSVRGMKVRSTSVKSVVNGSGKRWEVDFRDVLLFPDLIKHVQYSAVLGLADDGNNNNNATAVSGGFPRVSYGLSSVKDNRVVIQSDVQLPGATFYVTVHQSL